MVKERSGENSLTEKSIPDPPVCLDEGSGI